MERKKYLELLTTVDILNTVQGGSIEPQIDFTQYTNYREMKIRIPGVSVEAIDVTITNNTVTVAYFRTIESQGKLMKVPTIVYSKTQPYFVNVSKIKARIAGEFVVVQFPFNRLANGYSKRLKISEE